MWDSLPTVLCMQISSEKEEVNKNNKIYSNNRKIIYKQKVNACTGLVHQVKCRQNKCKKQINQSKCTSLKASVLWWVMRQAKHMADLRSILMIGKIKLYKAQGNVQCSVAPRECMHTTRAWPSLYETNYALGSYWLDHLAAAAGDTLSVHHWSTKRWALNFPYEDSFAGPHNGD